MTTPRVQRHRKAEADRRKVTTRGKRLPRPPRQRAPKSRRPRYRNAGALAAASTLFSTFAFMTGSLFWAVGACTAAAAGSYVARQAYKRELAEVKRTGRPVGAPATAKRPPSGPSVARRPPDARKPAGAGDHAARCKANPPGGPTCRCKDGPNRKGKPKTTPRKRKP